MCKISGQDVQLYGSWSSSKFYQIIQKSVGKTQYYIKQASQNHDYDTRCI